MDAEARNNYEDALDSFVEGKSQWCLDVLNLLKKSVLDSDGAAQHLRNLAQRIIEDGCPTVIEPHADSKIVLFPSQSMSSLHD